MTTPQELAEEFRGLAAEAYGRAARHTDDRPGAPPNCFDGEARAYEQAAQMVEDKLGTDGD